MEKTVKRQRLPKTVIYPSAFQQGYEYAFYGDTYGFGEGTAEEDFAHIPKNIKDKEQWLMDWHWGCAVGVEQ